MDFDKFNWSGSIKVWLWHGYDRDMTNFQKICLTWSYDRHMTGICQKLGGLWMGKGFQMHSKTLWDNRERKIEYVLSSIQYCQVCWLMHWIKASCWALSLKAWAWDATRWSNNRSQCRGMCRDSVENRYFHSMRLKHHYSRHRVQFFSSCTGIVQCEKHDCGSGSMRSCSDHVIQVVAMHWHTRKCEF